MVPHPRRPQQRHGGSHGGRAHVCASFPRHDLATDADSLSRIFWPFGADQPLTAVHVTDNLHAGYELVETRGGPDGLKPIYRSGRQPRGTVEALKGEVREVLGKAFGEDGEEKRMNLLKITSAVQHEWDDGGVARRDMAAFLSGI